MSQVQARDPGVVSALRIPPLNGGAFLMVVLIGALGFYVVYPLALILINSFNEASIVEEPAFGFQAWIDAFGAPGTRDALWNTVDVAL